MLQPADAVFVHTFRERLEHQSRIVEEIAASDDETKELLDMVGRPGDYRLQELGLNSETYMRRLHPINRWLEVMGYKVEFSHSSSFRNERLFVKFDKGYLQDFAIYRALN